MKKIILLLAACCFALLGKAQTSVAPTVGDGTSANPYQIATLDNLYWLSQNSPNTGKYFVQIADIDLTECTSWKYGFPATSFNGSYDGQNHIISNLYIKNSSSGDAKIGLFSQLTVKGVVKNVKLRNSSITGGSYVGGIAGYMFAGGNIVNCSNTGSVSGSTSVAGIVGESYGSVTDCYNQATISATGNDVGGIVGYASSISLTNCYNTGLVEATGTNSTRVGGLVGELASGIITNCYNTGAIACTTYGVGGIAGYFSGTVLNCHNTGTIIGNTYYVGGIVAYMINDNFSMTSCYNTGNVTGKTNSIGGIIGCSKFTGTIVDCYNEGVVSGDRNIGGIIGENYKTASIDKCHNSGTVNATAQVCGGIAGFTEGNLTNSYNVGAISGNLDVGGIVGTAYYGTIANNYNWGAIGGGTEVGGIVGYAAANTVNCYSKGKITGTSYIGGIIGIKNLSSLSLALCYWNTDTISTDIGKSTGGTNNFIGKITTEMTSTDFVSLLNANHGSYLTWKQGSEGYPVFDSTPTAIKNTVASSQIKASCINGNLIISGISVGQSIAVYNLQGTAIYNQKTTTETVSVNLPARGIYVVKVGNESVKVVY